MNVLWLARMLPLPLTAGDRIYTARLVEALAGAGARVRYLGLANPDEPALDARELSQAVTWEIIPGTPRGPIRALFSRHPQVGARFGIPAYAERLDALLAGEHWDAIVVDQYGLAWTLPHIARMRQPVRPVVVHIAHDFETEVTQGIASGYRGNPARKLALGLNARRTATAERTIAAASDLIVTLTEHDQQLFRSIGAKGDMLIVPPGYDGPRRETRTITAATPRRLGIVGSYRWSAKQMNLAAFLAAADARLAKEAIELHIVGDAPDDFRAEWEPRLQASQFRGFVDDLSAFLDTCRMGLVIEEIGGGFKLKVLDYVLTRTPVGALTPALGGQARDVTEHFVVADDAATLVDRIVAVIDDIDRLNAMQDASYTAASTRYDWGRNGVALRDAISAAQRAL